MTKKDNEIMSAYVSEAESTDRQTIVAETNPLFATDAPVVEQRPVSSDVNKPSKMAQIAREQRLNGGQGPLNEESGFKYRDNLGVIKLSVEDLPTKGMFYPTGTDILIRAARGAEIKHWSTMDDTDLKQTSRNDDILNYIIERCVTVRIPGVPSASWRDLKEIDRLYLILAVREFTFLNGDNELMIPIREGLERPVTKEDVDFIRFDDKIMKYYNSDDKCFTFTIKSSGRTINMFIPSLGVTQWIKNYYLVKQEINEGYDPDFIFFAPFLVADYRGLTRDAYEELIDSTSGWSAKEWSVVSYVRDNLVRSSAPVFKFTNDSGVTEEVPLTFRGGIKAIFTISDPLEDLC